MFEWGQSVHEFDDLLSDYYDCSFLIIFRVEKLEAELKAAVEKFDEVIKKRFFLFFQSEQFKMKWENNA